jgi:hypothetical protein
MKRKKKSEKESTPEKAGGGCQTLGLLALPVSVSSSNWVERGIRLQREKHKKK